MEAPAPDTRAHSARPQLLRLDNQFRVQATQYERQETTQTLRLRGPGGSLDFVSFRSSETFHSYRADGRLALEQHGNDPFVDGLNLFDRNRPFSTPNQSDLASRFSFTDPATNADGGERPNEASDAEEDWLEQNVSLRERLTHLLLSKLFGIEADDLKVLRSDWMDRIRSDAEDAIRQIREAYTTDGGNTFGDGFSLEAEMTQQTFVAQEFALDVKLYAQTEDANGNAIEQAVNVKVRFSSIYYQEDRLSLRLGTPRDPLVLDLSGSGIELSGVEEGEWFDLDADGALEKIAMVKGQTALLWLDRNKNGVLDNGLELFGDIGDAKDGFDALSQFDENGDGWIDERDSIFSELGSSSESVGEIRP